MMTDNRTTELLPCPFCGGEANVIDHHNDDGSVSVGCNNDTCLGFSGLGWLYKTEAKAIAGWNTRADRHAYEQRITGDISDWGEIMRDAYDDLMASACESCTPEQMRKLADHIRATLGSEHGTCHAESDLSEWVCSACQCWIPLGLTPENIKNASEWRFCPHCGAKVKAVKR